MRLKCFILEYTFSRGYAKKTNNSSNALVDIPEPAALVGLGLVGVAAARSRRFQDLV